MTVMAWLEYGTLWMLQGIHVNIGYVANIYIVIQGWLYCGGNWLYSYTVSQVAS